MSDESNNRSGNSKPGDSKEPETGKAAKADYENGYGKPPKANRFKKGQSGNPKGRKKQETIEDLRIVIEDILAEPVKLREGGQVRTVSKMEAMMHAQRVNALKGSKRAIRALFKLGQKTGMFTQAKPAGCMIIHPPGTDEQKMILRAFHAEQKALKGSGDGTPEQPTVPTQKPPSEGH